MISHKYKCIFIHIPRTAGTSIEFTLAGDDWWNIDPSTKHIHTQTAKRIYSKYWSSYFKFTIVRNPWNRIVSLLRYSDFYNIKLINNKLYLNDYIEKFPYCEIDKRSLSYFDNINFSIKNSLYLNLIQNELDYVVHFESLESGIADVFKNIGYSGKLKRYHCKSGSDVYKNFTYEKFYTDKTVEDVYQLYKTDINFFRYEFK